MVSTLGEFEQVVLLAALHLGEGAYGASVSEEIARRTRRTTSRGALYVTLDRLEGKGLLRSRLADASAARGGRPRRYVQVTAAGIRALRESRAALLNLWQGLEDRLELP
jgi:PadR family transcriptional regulator